MSAAADSAGRPAAAAAPEGGADVEARLRAVRLVVVDCDGVMTDGEITIDDRGVEQKRFNVHDGSAVYILRRCGIETAIISGRYAACLAVRAQQLRIARCIQGSRDKVASFADVAAYHGVAPEACAYMGDDILDVPLLRHVGLAAAPQNARVEAKAAAHLVTEASGGHGAIRELAERILRAQGTYETMLREVYGVGG